MKHMRCVVHEIGVTVRASEYSERIGEGKIVDFDRVLIPARGEAPAYTLGDALDGRHDCFVALVDEVHEQRQEPASPDQE